MSNWEDVEVSHAHSLRTLNILNGFDDFKRSIKNLLDVGSSKGFDLNYWANMRDINDDGSPGRPLNIKCTGVDLHNTMAEPIPKNVDFTMHDFNTGPFPFINRKFDVVWSHGSLQYAHSPIQLIGHINNAMNKDGMFYLCVPSTINNAYNKFENYTPAKFLNTFTLTQIIYYMALNGFDCKDAYFNKPQNEDMIEVLTYKNRKPFDYNTTWYELLEQDIFNENMTEIIMAKGYLTNQGLTSKWIDGTVHDYSWH
jgi:SAM-dependent methyltransferase